MEKKTGSAGTLVAPAAPTDALEADNADPGQVEEAKAAERGTKKGKYGSLGVPPMTPPPPPEEWEAKKRTWVALELVGLDDKPVTGVLYEVTDAEGRVYRGSTDHEGKGRVPGMAEGECTISFPSLDQDAWEEA